MVVAMDGQNETCMSCAARSAGSTTSIFLKHRNIRNLLVSDGNVLGKEREREGWSVRRCWFVVVGYGTG